MKQLKNLFYISIGFLLLFSSCKKEDTNGVSKITTPAEITLKGDPEVYIVMGTQYVDSGVTVKNGELVKTISTVIPGASGSYFVRYIVENNDGLTYSKTRKVFVLELGSDELDLSGHYDGARGAIGAGQYTSDISVDKVAKGVYKVSDFFAQYYEVFRGYGPDYACGGLLTYKGNGVAIMPVNSNSPWGPFNFGQGKASASLINGKVTIQYTIAFADGTSIASPFTLTHK
jgi:hypothetical protein